MHLSPTSEHLDSRYFFDASGTRRRLYLPALPEPLVHLELVNTTRDAATLCIGDLFRGNARGGSRVVDWPRSG